MQNLKKNRFVVSKMRGILIGALESLNGIFRAKYIMFDLKSADELSFMTLKRHAKFEDKLTCGLKNGLRNLANFDQNTWKCENWDFHGIFLSEKENA